MTWKTKTDQRVYRQIHELFRIDAVKLSRVNELRAMHRQAAEARRPAVDVFELRLNAVLEKSQRLLNVMKLEES